MATGLPTKANWAAGDVLTASNMDDLAGTVNLLQYSGFPFMAGKNALINGGMEICQRGSLGTVSIPASTTAANGYTLDRWDTATGANQAVTVSKVAVNDAVNLPNILWAARYQRNSGQTGLTTLNFGQSLESINSIPFAGKTVTLSFYARAGANYSSTGNVLNAYVISGTGSDQNRVAGAYVGDAAVATATGNVLTTTWQRFTVSGLCPTTMGEMAVLFTWNPTGTAGALDYFDITGVMLELGSTATNFVRAGASIGGELALCQRYCQSLNVLNPNGINGAYLAMGGGTGSSALTEFIFQLKVTMRIIPNLLSYLAINVSNGYSGVSAATLTISNHSTSDSLALMGGVAGTLGSVYWLATSSATASNIIWSAEV